MFSCVRDQSAIATGAGTSVTGQSRPIDPPIKGPSDVRSMGVPGERDVFDRVLEEGIRLKAKCKQLRLQLLQKDQELTQERLTCAARIEEMQSLIETAVADLNTQHFLELTHMKEHRIQEITDLQHQCGVLNNERVHAQSEVQAHQRALQHAEEERFVLQRTLEQLQSSAEQDLRYKTGYKDGMEYQRNETTLIEERAQQHIQSLEAEYTALHEKLQSMSEQQTQVQHIPVHHCVTCAQNTEKLQQVSQDMENEVYARARAQEESACFRGEVARLEKKVSVLQSELAQTQSMQLSPQLRSFAAGSAREQRLVQDLQAARVQIVELQQALEAMLLSKADVEDGVAAVAQENARLVRELNHVQLVQTQAQHSASFMQQTQMQEEQGVHQTPMQMQEQNSVQHSAAPLPQDVSSLRRSHRRRFSGSSATANALLLSERESFPSHHHYSYSPHRSQLTARGSASDSSEDKSDEDGNVPRRLDASRRRSGKLA